MNTLADILLKIASLLLPLQTGIESRKKDQRERLATFLEEISGCLEKTASQLRQKQIPHLSCSELGVYVESLERALERAGLATDEIRTLFDALVHASVGPDTAISLLNRRPEAIVVPVSTGEALVDIANSYLRDVWSILRVWQCLSPEEQEKKLEELVEHRWWYYCDYIRVFSLHDISWDTSIEKRKEFSRSFIEAWHDKLRAECEKIEKAAGIFKGTAQVLRLSK